MAVWIKVALMFLGAGVGANARYWLSWLLQRYSGEEFPWGTLVVNVSGSLVMGAVAALLVKNDASDSWRFLVAIGLLGGYTTFSTFSLETVALLRTQGTAPALGYVLLSNLGGIVLCGLAYWATERWMFSTA